MSVKGVPSPQEGSGQWNPGLYDDKHSFVWKYGEAVLSLLAPQAGERILDMGCGTGHLSAKIAESGAYVVGIDRSEEMIGAARKSYPQLQCNVADACHLVYQEEFDAVFSNATLHWIHEPEQVIRGVQAALRPHGRFVAEFGGKGNIRRMKQAFDQALEELGIAKAGKIDPWYYPSISEYAGLLERNGFEVQFIALIDRPTPLDDGERGMRNWITMFASDYLAQLNSQIRERFFLRVDELLRSSVFQDGKWIADYRRLRFLARKP